MKAWFFADFLIKFSGFTLLLQTSRENDRFFLKTFKLKEFNQIQLSELSCLGFQPTPATKLAFLKAQFQDAGLCLR